ncbi:MAG: sporulation protein YtfJ [Ruminococcaceae bacterium]|nr:sporulation protein YtfJ [Oscillospiraceae bacterium]
MEKKVSELLGVTMDKVKEMVDVDTVIGTPVTVEGITLIPVSKVTYGFAGGGSDLPTKSNKELFGGGSGAGITVTPIAFISVQDGRLNVLPLVTQPNAVDSLVSKLPDAINRISTDITRRREEKASK